MTLPSIRFILAAACLAATSLALNAQTKLNSVPAATHGSASAQRAKRTTTGKPVDINSATKAELKSLPGIQDPQADRIIAGRPYLTKARLVTRKILSAEQSNAIKKRIIAKQ
jgi:DNA uptake protein ComE-like DNA-binding protein